MPSCVGFTDDGTKGVPLGRAAVLAGGREKGRLLEEARRGSGSAP